MDVSRRQGRRSTSRARMALRTAGESGSSDDGKYMAGRPRESIRYLAKFHWGGRLQEGRARPWKRRMARGPVTREMRSMGNDTPKFRLQKRATWRLVRNSCWKSR